MQSLESLGWQMQTLPQAMIRMQTRTSLAYPEQANQRTLNSSLAKTQAQGRYKQDRRTYVV
jgi:hypothetical protein